MENHGAKISVYLIPGQGADERLFSKLTLDERFKMKHIKYSTPVKHESMSGFAKRLAKQIDQTKPFILIGTSLGGMLATEMAFFLKPEQIILISSAKKRSELPFRYRFQHYIPVYKIVPPQLVKLGAKIFQPLVEPDRNKEKVIFKAMLNAKDPKFLSRTIRLIVNWNRTEHVENIIHIHGNKDSTIPIKNVKFDYSIEGGSHMMTLTRANEISSIIQSILKPF